MKVCAEIGCTLRPYPMTRDVIAIAGSGRGAYTAVVIKPAHLSEMFDLYIKEVVAKPTVK